VLMADGSHQPIEDVRVGDLVLATDPESGRSESRPVAALITGEGDKHLVRITIDTDGRAGDATATVVATDNHPFWAPELDKWIKATDLRAGQWLKTSAGTWVQITAIQRWTQTARVHNLTIAAIHTYYVLAGTTPVLVHNCGFEDFAHGTTTQSGQDIVNNGLNTAASKANLFGSKAPGSFFTVPVNQADKQAALETAAFWGSRHGGQTCVIVCRLPKNVVADLESRGLLSRTETPVQAVFHPDAFPIINQHAQWFGPIPVG
jgi:Pretoxin HINT domain